jgi:hypothetical protein
MTYGDTFHAPPYSSASLDATREFFILIVWDRRTFVVYHFLRQLYPPFMLTRSIRVPYPDYRSWSALSLVQKGLDSKVHLH